jgi:CHASE3 domain sensor protein
MPSNNDTIIDSPFRKRAFLPFGTALGLGLALAALIVVGILTARSVQNDADTGDRVTHTMAVLENLESLLSQVKDAETSQRGYLLTNKETYLVPFTNAKADIGGVEDSLKKLLTDSPDQLTRLDKLTTYIDQKLAELTQTVDLARAGNPEEALVIVRTDRGKLTMDSIRTQVATMEVAERASLAQRQNEWKASAADTARIVLIGVSAVLILLIIGGFVLSRDYKRQLSVSWTEAGLATLSTRL